MKSQFDKIFNDRMVSIQEVATQAQDKAILADLNAKIQSLPPTEKGPIMDLLTSLQNMGGRLVASPKLASPSAGTTDAVKAGMQTTPTTPETTTGKQPEAVKPPSPEETKQKTAQNVALAQAKAAGDAAAGYAKG